MVALYVTFALYLLCKVVHATNDVTAREALKGVDIVDERHYNEVVFDVSITPGNMLHHDQPFCARLITTLWLSDEDITQASNPTALFDILKKKFVARATSSELEQHSSLFKRLAALGYLASQGKLQIVENNVQNETKNLRFSKKLPTTVVDRQRWEQLASSVDEFSLTITDGACKTADEAESVELETDAETSDFVGIAFPNTLHNGHGAESTAPSNETQKQEQQAHAVPNGGDAPIPYVDGVNSEVNGETMAEGEKPADATKGQDGTGKGEKQKPESNYKPLSEAEETKAMDLFVTLDMQDNPNDKVRSVMVTINAMVVSNDRPDHKRVTTRATVLLPEKDFKECEAKDYKKCITAIRDKLFDRYEAEASKQFVRGRFISLLQSLMLQYSIGVKHVEKDADGMFELLVYVPKYITKFANYDAWNKLMGDAHSSDKRIEIGMSFTSEEFEYPEDATRLYLGMRYSEIKYENKFMIDHPELELGAEFYKQQTNEADASVEHPKEPEAAPAPAPEQHPPESSQDMHRMVSAYERALLQVPKEINGYQLSFKDIEKFPELQRIWKLGLVTMKLMKEEEDLKEFIEKHTFTYDQLRDLFNFTYGVIAVNNYEEAREFYESAKIPKEAVETSLAMVQNIFKANTATNITRLPPVIKKMAHACPVKDMIISLATDDLIDRIHVMMSSWIEGFTQETLPELDFHLAALCSASAVFVEQWRYIQTSQGYREEGIPWALLLQSFSKMGQSSQEDPKTRENFKTIINSNAAKICRKYMNQAGSIASSPYKGITRNYESKSLTGAIGNALDVNMESSPSEFVSSLQTYFSTANQKERIGSAMGICMSLQILDRMHKCLSVENSNDFSLYKLQLLTHDVAQILEQLTSTNIHIEGKQNELVNFIHRACDPRDSLVEEVVDALFKLSSNEGHGIIMDVLEKRHYNHPKIGQNGELIEEFNDLNLADNEYVELEDNETLSKVLKAPQAGDMPVASFLDIHKAQEDEDAEWAEYNRRRHEMLHMMKPDANSPKHCGGTKQQKKGMTLYDKFINKYMPYGIAHPADMKTVTFDFRMLPKFDADGTFKSIVVPLSFHKKETEYLRLLKTLEFLHVVIRKVEERLAELKRNMPTADLLHHVRAISNLEDKDEVTLSLDKRTVQMNRRLNDVMQLLTVLNEMPHDGFYFEHENGREVPPHEIGNITAKTIENGDDTQSIVMQIIDPVHIVDQDDLFVH
ncbi:hypothetical protein X943_001644 [Babesia divergens]|uniref:Uncharacterized protein n=1 Tax=Babesia divergens TaxID=32595 RepID=A0AAD9GFG1_BABDI|nr:hypothetical protein X943_001644 [Babesia divergens]